VIETTRYRLDKTLANDLKNTLEVSIMSQQEQIIRPSNITAEIIRPRDLPSITGLSRTTCWRLERAKDFPPKIQLSVGCVGYKRAEILAWLESRQTV
jgi:prophage regulatory protein